MLSDITTKRVLALAAAVAAWTLFSDEVQTRWRVNGDRTGIEWDIAHETRLPHRDRVEMSGAKVSVLLHYGVTEKRELSLCPTVIGPTFRMRSTGCSNQLAVAWADSSRPRICVGGKVLDEKVCRIVFDGLWTAETELDCGLQVKRHVFASVSDAAAYETIEIANQGSQTLDVSLVGGTSREEAGVKGRYAVSAASDSPDVVSLAPGRVVKRGIRYGIRFADEKDSGFDAFAELKARRHRIEELASEAVLETPVPEFDVMYRLGKIRTGEAIFDLDCGLVHSPGGGKFYGGFWLNDNVEYVGPWFGLTGDTVTSAAFTNMCLITMGDMTDDYSKFIPAAYMAEGLFKWRVKERGDAAMFASGAANFVLLRGDRGLAERMLPGIEWGLEFSRRKLTEDGVVASDYDELEGRYPTGKANLSTSCIYLDALKKSVLIERALGHEEKAMEYEKEAGRQAAAIERHFGACLGGWNTYRYFAGYDKLRGWTAIPLCVGLHTRAKDTMEALLSPRIWHDHAMLTEEGDPKKVVWDRSLLSAFRGFFSAGLVDEAMPKFTEFVHARLLGEHVPHAVEQFPFRKGAHLAAEGALLCRIFTDGIFGITPSGLGTISVNPRLPSGWRRMALRNLNVGGRKIDITVTENGTEVVQAAESGIVEPGRETPEEQAGARFVIEGDDWIPLKYIKTPTKGSALDFSGMSYIHRPAGKFGRVVVRNGHFEFANLPGVPQRFYGVNLCNDVNFPDRKTAVELAERLSRMGYNCVRIHHHDRILTGGKGPEIDCDAADRMDFLVAELIKRGIYIESDLFASRGKLIGKDLGIEEPSKPWGRSYEIKTLFTLHPPAFSNWCAFARSWLTHRNPYTGRTYAEEPCWTGMSLINEGRYVFPYEQTRHLAPFKNAWKNWIAARRKADPSCYPGVKVSDSYPRIEWTDMRNGTMPQVCCDFAADMQRGFLAMARTFLKDEIGFMAPLTNENNAPDNAPMQLARSDAFDYVETHAYGAGQGRGNPCRVPNNNVFQPAQDNITEVSWQRLADKPFSLTETSYGQPNPHRAGGYAKIGALAALQDWGSVFHFAYAHGLRNFPEGKFGGAPRFDIQQDPVKALADKIPQLLFLRRDLEPAPEGVALVIDDDALHPESGIAATSVPPWGTNLMWRCRVGTVAAGHSVEGFMTLPLSEGFARKNVPIEIQGSPHVSLDESTGLLKVDTEKTIVGCLSYGTFKTRRLTCDLGDKPATIVATALDGRSLESSDRILFMLLGDVQRLGEVFSDASRTFMLKRGDNGRTVVRRMVVQVCLRVDLPSECQVYAIDTAGRRLGKVHSKTAGNKLTFTACTEFAPGTGVVAWEIIRLKMHVAQSCSGYNAWPMIQAIGDGKLICTYSRGSGHSIGEGRRDAFARVSKDGGITWGDENVVSADPDEGEVMTGKGDTRVGPECC